MKHLSKVLVYLLNDTEDYYESAEGFDGLLRVESVQCYDENGKIIKEIEPLIKNGGFFNAEYHTAIELINDIANRLSVSPSIVDIE